MKSLKLSADDKRKLLETRVADGETLRGELKKQIEMSKILRHEYAKGYRIGVESWFTETTGILEDVFDTKMIASKFRNVYQFRIGSFESPRISLIDTRTDQEKLEELDRQMKRGIQKLERILEEFKKQNPRQEPFVLRLLKNGSFFVVILGVVLWVIYKLTGVDLRSWLK